MTLETAAPTAGDYLRMWRERRGFSQLDLALEADISQRHLSFLECGRSMPSRRMVLHLAERLDIPLRDRNDLLVAAGFAPVYTGLALDDPAMAAARAAIARILKGHEPFPALAIDRHWNLVTANAALAPLLAGIRDGTLLQAPINVLRLSLHPNGLAPRIVNLDEWRDHLLERLRRQIAATRDPVLAGLLQELSAYSPGERPRDAGAAAAAEHGGVLVPLKLATDAGLLSFLSTTTVFGMPRDILLSEIAIEAFFPADAETGTLLRRCDGP